MDANAYNPTTKLFTSGTTTYYILGTVDQSTVACPQCAPGAWTIPTATNFCEGTTCSGLNRTITCAGPGDCAATSEFSAGKAGESRTIPCGKQLCARAALAQTYTGCFDGNNSSVSCGGNKYRQYNVTPLAPMAI